MARDFQGAWPGLKEYAIKVGVVEVGDTDDVICDKIKNVLAETLPKEEEEEKEEEEKTGLFG